MKVRMSVFATAFLCLACLNLVHERSHAQVLTKPQVSEKIKNVEDGTDDFIDYLERKGENARASAGSSSGSRGRRGNRNPTDAQKARAEEGKDELEDNVKDLEKATDRLRRRFKRVDNFMDTRREVENVVDKGREINQIVARGNYGTEVARVWAALRVAINDLARIYGVTPMAA